MAINLDRQKILDAARQQFAKTGLRKTSLTDIAKPLGVGKTAVYHHFRGGKRELMEEVMRHEEEVLLNHLRRAIARESDPRKQLRALIVCKLNHGRQLRKLLAVSRDVGEEIASIYATRERSFNSEELSIIEEILKRGMAKKVFKPADPLQLAASLQMLARRVEMVLVFEMTPRTMEQQIDDLFDILFYGIAVPPKKKKS
jgi:AcrR family transcriptional regulator